MKRKMGDKENIKKIELEYKDNIENIFTDIIEVNVIEDSVSLCLGVRLPNTNKVIVSHRIFMTLSHFLRLNDVCRQTTDLINKNINKTHFQEKKK